MHPFKSKVLVSDEPKGLSSKIQIGINRSLDKPKTVECLVICKHYLRKNITFPWEKEIPVFF